MGSMYSTILFISITNGTAVQPVVSVERFVSYRERAAWMYSALSFAFAQVVIEFPYVFAQAMIYSTIFYSMASFVWTVDRFIWYLFFMYFTMLYFTFYGMMTTAVTPNHNVVAIIAAPFYMLWNLFNGFMIPHKVWKLILIASFWSVGLFRSRICSKSLKLIANIRFDRLTLVINHVS
uniref:ABC transporter G family member 32 n=1 Tax=Cajanus cajan TaxID=3821 RepID=A0A151QLC2_CAJCA|nr:ABC transporter G family member 32 [Cajanus cajan]